MEVIACTVGTEKCRVIAFLIAFRTPELTYKEKASLLSHIPI